MVANSIGLTNRGIYPVAGMAALLPNQPILHGVVVSPAETAKLQPGTVVALADDANLDDMIVVKQAEVTDTPLGVVAYSAIKSGFVADDRISVFPVNSYVYMPAGAADINRGAKLQFNADNQVVATATAGNGYVGIAMTQPGVAGDLIVVQIAPGLAEAAASTVDTAKVDKSEVGA